MEHEEVDVRRGQPRLFQRGVHAGGDGLHGEFEHLRPLHGQDVWLSPAKARQTQENIVPPAAQHGPDGGPALPALHHGGGRAVPKEDAGAPVRPIHHAAQSLRPHHQTEFPGGGVQQALHSVESIDKAGAGGVQVETGGILRQTQRPLQQTGGRGHHGVRRDGGHDAHADVRRGDPGHVQGVPRGADAQLREGLFFTAVAAADACAGGDPLVIGIHQPGKIVIGDGIGGDTAACAPELDPVHASSFPRPRARNF